jgi:putative membrane protein (TIGR04086 family)
MRLILAVVTGYVIFAVAAALLFQFSGQDPHATPGMVFGVVSVIWGMAFAALGGYVAARASQRAGLLASVLVGCLIASGALVSLVSQHGEGAWWSQISAIVLMAPATSIGGMISRRKQRSGTSATAPDPASSQ